jgi:hypothetical protein
MPLITEDHVGAGREIPAEDLAQYDLRDINLSDFDLSDFDSIELV